MGFDGILADADHVEPLFLQVGQPALEFLGFGRAARGVVLGVGIEDKALLPVRSEKRLVAPVWSGNSNFGGLVFVLDMAHTPYANSVARDAVRALLAILCISNLSGSIQPERVSVKIRPAVRMVI